MAFGGGLLKGFNEGLDARLKNKRFKASNQMAKEKFQLQKDKFDQSQINQANQASQFKFNAAGKVLENKGFTNSAKLDYYNNEYVPLAQEIGIRLPTLTEWDPQMQDYLRRIDAIVNDPNLDKSQKQFGLSKIDIESRGTIKSRAEFDLADKSAANSEKAQLMDILREIEKNGKATQAQQKAIKSARPTVREAAFKEFRQGEGKRPTSEKGFIAQHIQELIDGGMSTKEAIDQARKDFPKQRSVFEELIAERFGFGGEDPTDPGGAVNPATGRQLLKRRTVDPEEDPLGFFKDELNSPGIE